MRHADRKRGSAEGGFTKFADAQVKRTICRELADEIRQRHLGKKFSASALAVLVRKKWRMEIPKGRAPALRTIRGYLK